MPTIKFDWDKWSRSMWNAMPKNGMWKAIRSGTNDEDGKPEYQYADEAVHSNRAVNPTDAEDVRIAHRYRTDRGGVWQDFSGDVSTENWQDHFDGKVSTFLAVAPVITQATVPDATAGEAFTFTFEAVGTAPITWSRSGDSGTGLTLNSATGVLSGTAGAAGDYSVTVTATNAKGADSYTFTLTIGAAE
ncbi:hypothetical protein MINTM005_13190 [Mycobacterium intracellulare]|uniref:Ig domain-containing protein n=1 Tax=Mycobacterium intracellulare TaxID=1767 RepID=UPI0019260DE0|nr:Ig domain-containing protein [Mycobacterium intracellulare]BCO56075.1 hypothetical protein MINTM005_13190 [Mycobacterium intracellulare]